MGVPITFVPCVFNGSEWDEAAHAYMRRDLPPGAAVFLDSAGGIKDAALSYVCPCGCSAVGCVSISTGEKQHGAWLWDGNREAPTLQPSIQRVRGCRWHGFLQKGVWVNA